jgi:hypothetical protein
MTDEEKAAAAAAAEAAAQAEADAAAAAAAAAAKAATGNESNTNAADTAALTAAADAAKAEAARLQAIVDGFAGIDPEQARKDREAITAAEAARLEAEKERAKAEGNFERLREIQQAEAAAEIAAAKEEARIAKEEAAAARAEANAERISTAFANSTFLQEETILSGPRAQRLFADHVEIEGGKVVVYDKPAGEAKRAKVMDNKGNALSFNDAIAKVIQSQSDKDTLLKAKTKPGAASTTTQGRTAETQASRQSRIAAGLKALREK